VTGVQGTTSFGRSFDRFTQLPEVLRLVGIAEVQVIGDGQRLRAGAGQIARRFGDRNLRAFAGIKRAVERIAITRRR